MEYFFVTEPMCDHTSTFEIHPGGSSSPSRSRSAHIEEYDVQRR